jgi:hypothetical protein
LGICWSSKSSARVADSNQGDEPIDPLAAMVGNARLLAEAELAVGTAAVAEGNEAAVGVNHIAAAQAQRRIRGIHFSNPFSQLRFLHPRGIRTLRKQPMPDADQGAITPRHGEQVTRCAAHHRVAVAARSGHRQGIG